MHLDPTRLRKAADHCDDPEVAQFLRLHADGSASGTHNGMVTWMCVLPDLPGTAAATGRAEDTTMHVLRTSLANLSPREGRRVLQYWLDRCTELDDA